MNESAFFKLTQQRQLSGAYLLYGVEELTKQEAVKRVTALAEPDFASLNVSRMISPSREELLSCAMQFPFADNVRVIVASEWYEREWDDSIALADVKPKERRQLPSKALPLSKLPNETILLFVQRGAVKRSSPIYKALEPLDRLVEFEALTPDRAVNLLMREAGLLNAELDRQTARRLVDMVGTDAYKLVNEFSKAAGYVGASGRISDSVLRRCVTPSVEYSVFNMLDSFLSGNRSVGMRQLYGMLSADKNGALGLSSFMLGRMKNLLIARELMDAGVSTADAKRRIGGSPYAAEMTLKKAAKLQRGQLETALTAFADVDEKLKQGLIGDADGLFMAIVNCF